MLLKKEKVKKYITVGDEAEAYVYRKNDEIWFIAFRDEARNSFHSRLLNTNSYNCSYFVHKSVEEIESFLNSLIMIEELVNSKGYDFERFISQYWNVITDHLLFHWEEKEKDTIPYIEKLLKNWVLKLEKYKIEFEALIEKKRTKWDAYTLWDDDKLYELSKKFGYLIPEDVLKSKNDVMLDNLLSKTQELIDKTDDAK